MGRKLNKKGVSLAELLAVVVIMGIIAAIAIPLVGNVIETSKKKAFLGDLVTVSEAARTYCVAEGDGTGFCKNHELTIDDTTSGLKTIVVKNGKVTDYASTGDGDNAFFTGNDETLDTKLDLYMSKKQSDIATTINIIQINNKFYMQVDGATSKFVLAGGNAYVDPTDPNALENIPDK